MLRTNLVGKIPLLMNYQNKKLLRSKNGSEMVLLTFSSLQSSEKDHEFDDQVKQHLARTKSRKKLKNRKTELLLRLDFRLTKKRQSIRESTKDLPKTNWNEARKKSHPPTHTTLLVCCNTASKDFSTSKKN